jgi:hypothetical protein
MTNTSEAIPKRLTFVRSMVMRTPDITLDQVHKEWTEAGGSSSDLPKLHDIHISRSFLRKKYGVEDLSQIPRKKNGDLNITGILRSIRNMHPDYNMRKVRNFVASDGIEFTDSLWSVMASHEKKIAAKGGESPKKTDSPDANQNSGPRARYFGKRKSSRKTKNVREVQSVDNNGSEIDLLKVEIQLDKMIQDAHNARMEEVAKALRDARRHVSSGILKAR